MFPLHHTTALSRSEGGWELLSTHTAGIVSSATGTVPGPSAHTAEPPGSEPQVTHPTGSMAWLCPARIYYLGSFISPQSFMGRGQGDTLLLTTWFLQSKCTNGCNSNPSKCTVRKKKNFLIFYQMQVEKSSQLDNLEIQVDWFSKSPQVHKTTPG